MKKITLVTMLLACGLIASCATGPVGGILFTSTQSAGEVNPANDVPVEKSGTGCQRSVLGLITWGSAGAGDVAKENGISRIATIDHSNMNVLFLVYRDYCTIVYGK